MPVYIDCIPQEKQQKDKLRMKKSSESLESVGKGGKSPKGRYFVVQSSHTDNIGEFILSITPLCL